MKTNGKDEGDNVEELISEDDESNDEGSSDDELMEDDKIDEMEKLNFDFEALPPDTKDVNQISNLLTQVFLRTDIEFEKLAMEIVNQSPAGCVFKTIEEQEDDENDDTMVYGVSSVVRLTNDQSFGIGEFLAQRAKKFADSKVVSEVEKLSAKATESKIGIVINERMLNIPVQIAGPTLAALKNDIETDNELKKLETFIMILKVRFNESSAGASNSAVASKPKGKAAKKRALADKLSLAEIVYDNEEEMLLFEANDQSQFPYFQYPVHFDVEKKSKFHVVRRNNETYFPYRRVCLLNKQQLFEFLDKVTTAFS